jgi:CubicO group peptidase (beta-lactamase class C family)
MVPTREILAHPSFQRTLLFDHVRDPQLWLRWVAGCAGASSRMFSRFSLRTQNQCGRPNSFDQPGTEFGLYNRRMQRDRLLLLLLFLLVPGIGRADQADDYVARWLADFHVPGVALAVIKDGQIVKMQGYGRANREDRELTAAERQQMMTAAPLSDGTFAPYGFGWHVEQFNGHRYIWHGGGLPGFSSNFARFPDDRLTIIALSNGDDVDMGALIAHLALMFPPSK